MGQPELSDKICPMCKVRRPWKGRKYCPGCEPKVIDAIRRGHVDGYAHSAERQRMRDRGRNRQEAERRSLRETDDWSPSAWAEYCTDGVAAQAAEEGPPPEATQDLPREQNHPHPAQLAPDEAHEAAVAKFLLLHKDE